MAWRSSGESNQQLADNLRSNRVLKSKSIYKAFCRVDRAIFVPNATASAAGAGGGNEDAYADRPVRVGKVHISAPHMYASILEALELRRGMSFLNLASGSGYLSNLAAVLVGPRGISIGVEREAEVVDWARKCTARCLAQQPKPKRPLALGPVSALATAAAPATAAATTPSASAVPAATADEKHTKKQKTEPNTSASSTAAGAATGGGADAKPAPEIGLTAPATTAAAAKATTSTSASSVSSSGGAAAASSPSAAQGNTPAAAAAAGRGGGSGGGGGSNSLIALMLGIPVSMGADGTDEPEEEDDPFRADDYGRDTKAPAASAASSSAATATAGAGGASTKRSAASLGATPIDDVPEEEDGMICESTYVVGNVFAMDEKQNLQFDRIYVGAAAPPLRKSYFTRLLRPGGVLVAPFGDELLKVTRRPNDELVTSILARVAFAPLIIPSKAEFATLANVVLPEPVFDPVRAPFYSARFNESVDCLLMLQRRPTSGARNGGLIAKLPKSILLNVVEYFHRDWFYQEPTELDLLKDLLRAETKAREAAEARATKAERERDEAMLMCMFLRTRVQRPPARGGSDDEDGDDDDATGDGGSGATGDDDDTDMSADAVGSAGGGRARGGNARGRGRGRGGGSGGGSGGAAGGGVTAEDLELMATARRVVGRPPASIESAGSTSGPATNAGSGSGSGSGSSSRTPPSR